MALRVGLISLGLVALVTGLACALSAWLFPRLAGAMADRAEVVRIAAAVCGLLAPPALTPLVWTTLRYRALSARLHRAALTDPLTGVPNRRAFFDHAAARLAGLEPRRFAVLMIDADRFKDLNDRHGHEAGDAALVRIAQGLAAALARAGPPASMLARLGGEEFAAYLEDAGPREARQAAEAACAAIRGLAFHHRGKPIPLTVSIGVWSGFDIHVDGPLAEADLAVYRAKANGRDRWEMADDVEEAALWEEQAAPARPLGRIRRLGRAMLG